MEIARVHWEHSDQIVVQTSQLIEVKTKRYSVFSSLSFFLCTMDLISISYSLELPPCGLLNDFDIFSVQCAKLKLSEDAF